MPRPSTAVEMPGLWRRVGVTLGALLIYRLGGHIPLPGIDPWTLQQIFERNATRGLDIFAGGAASRMSILALGVIPYISASTTLLLLSAAWQKFLRRPLDAYSLDAYARLGATVLAVPQALAIAIGLERAGGVSDPGPLFELGTAFTLTAGSVFTMWLADQITRRGIGNGVGLILFSHIVSRLPSAMANLLERGRGGAILPTAIALCLVLVAAVVALIVFMESAERRILVLYRPRLVGSMMFEGEGAYLTLKPNGFGIIPVSWASSLALLPATLASRSADPAGWIATLARHLQHGSLAFMAYYAGLIVFLAFLYSALLISPRAMAAALTAYDGTADRQAPGEATAHYLARLRNRLTLTGAVYVAAICLLPEILVSLYQMPFYFGGSSLLVTVCVALDLLAHIRAHLGLPRPGRGSRRAPTGSGRAG
ncbi:MAG TPA: preprotein translocase subunit SecY [Stellaceae bacterium]